MLLTICSAAVFLQLPYTVIYLVNADKYSLWPDNPSLYAKMYLCKMVTDTIATFNYAVNFALYCVSGSAFRHSVRSMCRRLCKQQNRGEHRQLVTASPMSISMTALTMINPSRLSPRLERAQNRKSDEIIGECSDDPNDPKGRLKLQD